MATSEFTCQIFIVSILFTYLTKYSGNCSEVFIFLLCYCSNMMSHFTLGRDEKYWYASRYLSMYSCGKAGEIHIVRQLQPRHPLRFRFVSEQRQWYLFRDGTEARRGTRIVIEGNKVAERNLRAVT